MRPRAHYPAGLCLLLLTLASQAQTSLATHAAQAARYLKENRPDMAAKEFAAIVAFAPGNVDAQTNLGVLLFFGADYGQAAEHLRAALKLQPGVWRTQALLGMCEKRTGDFAAAEKDLSQSFPPLQDPKIKLQAGLELAELYYSEGGPQKAVGVVEQLRVLQPEDATVLYLSYRIYSELARQSALGLATFAPESPRMRQIEAQELARQGKYPEAIARYRTALASEPRLPGAHFELAEILNIAGDGTGAEKEYGAALADNPADAKAESRLGELALRTTDLKGAAEHFSRALGMQPDDAATCVGMARVLIAANQPAKALSLLERASRIEPLEPAAHYQLGLVYRALGRNDEARRELDEFARLKESNARLKQVYRQLNPQ